MPSSSLNYLFVETRVTMFSLKKKKISLSLMFGLLPSLFFRFLKVEIKEIRTSQTVFFQIISTAECC